jgi:hypothetical protein
MVLIIYFLTTQFFKSLFNLNLIIPQWETNFKNPATTQFYNTNKIEKEVAYLEITKAKQWKQM